MCVCACVRAHVCVCPMQVVVDIRMYLLYLLLAMWGFACAFCV
jgi:hypothetical protein